MNVIKKFNELNLFDKDKYILKEKILTDEIVGISFLSVKEYQKTSKNIAIVAQNLYIAEQIRDLVIDFVGNENVIYIPSEDFVESEYISSSPDIKCDRISGLSRLLHENHKIIVLNVASAIKFYPNPKLFLDSSIELKCGLSISIGTLREKLIENGYSLQNKVEKSGDCSFRGDIVDIFPINEEFPIRIEFFDDEIETIKKFKIETQESFEKVDTIYFSPANEILFSKEEKENFKTKINKFNSGSATIFNDFEDLINGKITSQNSKYYSLLQDKHYSIFDYFNCECLFICNKDQCNISFEKLLEDQFNFVTNLVKERKGLQEIKVFQDKIDFEKSTNLIIENTIGNDSKTININKPYFTSNDFLSVINQIRTYSKEGYKIFIYFDNEQQINFFKTSLILENIKDLQDFSNVEYINYHLSNGLLFENEKVLFLSTKEIFGLNYSRSKYQTRFKNSTIIKKYDELKVGDYVVHEKYGIALYNGIKRMKANELENDYMVLKYEGTDVLYVPLEQFKYIRKYVGRDGYIPKLSKLYSSKWEKTKENVKSKVNFLADKLALLYKEREENKGFAFKEDDIFSLDFANKFPYKLTKDQQNAIDEVNKDMESQQIMDRLICGDVGFGKTEIAFRAAFKCINSGKQVLLLCPTTLLAKQHYSRAIERFAGFGVKISCLTRFLSVSEFKKAVEDIKLGKTHFIIGTHKALSNKISFNDIGLLIIDEEQRFGVEHKELITIANKNIDVLTLSATPIPRTLQLSLIGMKSISLINTAPEDRNPIQTYLVEHNPNVIYELISRELGRKGQVYYVKNSISNLFDIKIKLETNIPGINAAVINGQMDKKDIDNIMSEFYDGKVQVLIATTIVENGIDVARANLIIIEDADKFGLAQLYQLKGRVGRSNRLAYAYLTYDSHKQMDEIATKRLKTIQEFTELGSGYKIAQRDLMIRGAGDILGPQQAGFINEVGIDLYLKLLNDAIKQKEGKEINKEIEYKKINANGFIPDKYANESNKFEIYKWIDDASSDEALALVEGKIIDIYGKIPAELANVIQLRSIKILLLNEEFLDFSEDKYNFSILLSDKFNKYDGIGYKLFSLLFSKNNQINLFTSNQKIKIVVKKYKNYLDVVYNTIKKIDKLYKEYKENEIR